VTELDGFYQTRRVLIEARRLGDDPNTDTDTIAWCGGRVVTNHDGAVMAIDHIDDTRNWHATMWASPGDWIIRLPDGRFYPVRDDVFGRDWVPTVE